MAKTFEVGKEFLLCLLLSIVFAIFVCYESDRILNRQERRAEAVEMELAILSGQSFHESGNFTYKPAFQNRILFPLLLRAGIRIGLFSPAGWYVLLRLSSAVAMFATFWYVLRKQAKASVKLAGAGLLLLTYCLLFSFSLPLVLTSDFPDGLFAGLFIAAALSRKRWLLLSLSMIAAANRESAVLAGVIWIFLYAVERNRRVNLLETFYGLLVSIVTYGVVLLLRYGFGGPRAVGANTQLVALNTFLYLLKVLLEHPLSPFSWLSLNLCMIAPAVLWIVYNRGVLSTTDKRLLLAAAFFAAASCIFGIASEPRIFIPTVVLLIFVAVSTEGKISLVRRQPNELSV